jgi:hypothetical protein
MWCVCQQSSIGHGGVCGDGRAAGFLGWTWRLKKRYRNSGQHEPIVNSAPGKGHISQLKSLLMIIVGCNCLLYFCQ